MEWTSLNDLREKYLSFFESKGHLRLPSFSLVPQGDNSLLLINSGMAPMKKYFTGEVTPPRTRVTTCQKCIRTPDIEQVGKTDRHGTFFEMLGNFSFGDYFKKEATAWAWEFCTKVLEMPEDKLYVTIYQDDDEAFEIWTKQNGVDPSHIVRLGKEDNFWEHGSGPCGPCSEIYFDRGEKYGCGSPDCGPGCECDRYVEFWNNVFSQFNNDGNGNYTELKQKNIDTGMGLERLACILQGVDNIFEVDTVQNIMKKISEISGAKYHEDAQKDVSLRVITDHVRSATFMIGDGVIPSNNGRGYVLRRLIRRACRHGRLLGVNEPFLYKVCDTVIHENHVAYPELADKAELIKKIILSEEESFGKTIDAGLAMLDEYISKLDGNVFSGEDAFKLNDTFGFPLDLTKDILEEKGITVDEDKFNALLAAQKATARAARKDAGADAWKGNSVKINASATDFVGYTDFACDAKVLAIVNADGELVDMLGAGDSGTLVLDKTPFYAQSGGQVGDSGVIKNGADNAFIVADTVKNADKIFLHRGEVTRGIISVGDPVQADINAERRRSIMRNHTAAHLLQAALRQVLGTHVEQAGQLVDEREVRFDFTHFNAMTRDELLKVEHLVNAFIMGAHPVESMEMPIDEAKKLGAMMLFGEKYGDVVRVVSVGAEDQPFSRELCGGTHAANTAELGLFKIISESSTGSNVRRIEAVTSKGALDYMADRLALVDAAAAALKCRVDEVPARVENLQAELRETSNKLKKALTGGSSDAISSAIEGAVELDGYKLVVAELQGLEAADLRNVWDTVHQKVAGPVACVVASVTEKGTPALLAAGSDDAVKAGFHAGNVIKQIAGLVDGRGGGRPNMAQAGGKNAAGIADALAAAKTALGA